MRPRSVLESATEDRSWGPKPGFRGFQTNPGGRVMFADTVEMVKTCISFRRVGHRMLCNSLVFSCRHQKVYQEVCWAGGLQHQDSLLTKYVDSFSLLV